MLFRSENRPTTEQQQEFNSIQQQELKAIEQPAAREITQTDHLNKRLLDSFLQRINAFNPNPNPTAHGSEAEWDDNNDSVIKK